MHSVTIRRCTCVSVHQLQWNPESRQVGRAGLSTVVVSCRWLVAIDVHSWPRSLQQCSPSHAPVSRAVCCSHYPTIPSTTKRCPFLSRRPDAISRGLNSHQSSLSRHSRDALNCQVLEAPCSNYSRRRRGLFHHGPSCRDDPIPPRAPPRPWRCLARHPLRLIYLGEKDPDDTPSQPHPPTNTCFRSGESAFSCLYQ